MPVGAWAPASSATTAPAASSEDSTCGGTSIRMTIVDGGSGRPPASTMGTNTGGRNSDTHRSERSVLQAAIWTVPESATGTSTATALCSRGVASTPSPIQRRAGGITGTPPGARGEL